MEIQDDCFLECCNFDLMEVIKSDIPSPLDATCKLLPRDTWS